MRNLIQLRINQTCMVTGSSNRTRIERYLSHHQHDLRMLPGHCGTYDLQQHAALCVVKATTTRTIGTSEKDYQREDYLNLAVLAARCTRETTLAILGSSVFDLVTPT